GDDKVRGGGERPPDGGLRRARRGRGRLRLHDRHGGPPRAGRRSIPAGRGHLSARDVSDRRRESLEASIARPGVHRAPAEQGRPGRPRQARFSAPAARRTLTGTSPGWEVRWAGAQRNLMAARIRSTGDLNPVARRPSLCALGPREQLQGEITVIRGRPAVSRVVEDRIVVDASFDHRAPFLAWVKVNRWRERPLAAPATNLAEIDALV